jgi:hypothetical protein
VNELKLRKMELPKELTEAFDKELIKINYNKLRFVDPIHYFDRLMQLVGMYFTYKIRQEYVPEEKAVMVVVSIGFQLEDGTWLWKEGNSGKELYNDTADGPKKINGGIGYALKIAASNATKRALLLMGVGKELYDDQDEIEDTDNKGGYTKGKKPYDFSRKPTDKQVNFLRRLRQQYRVSDSKFNEMLDSVGAESIEVACQQQVSDLIDMVQHIGDEVSKAG